MSFTFTDGVTREGTTDAEGDVGFANLPEGAYTITGGAPGEFTDYVVYCAVGTAETSNQQPVEFEYVTGGVQFFLPADTNVICDWYTIPLGEEGQPTATQAPETGESSIEVHNRICPTEYAGDNFFGDCHDNPPDPGLSFTFTDGVTREGTTDAQGDVGFANLPEGTYTITGGVPGEFAERVVYCAVGTEETSNQEPVEFEYVTGGIQFFLPADTNVICDWYQIPFDLQGDPTPTTTPETDDFDLPIFKLICDAEPAQQAVGDFLTVGTVPAGCEQFAGVNVTVMDADGTVLGSCVTEAAAPCYVTVTVGATVYGTEDTATVPEGYVPLEGETIEVPIEPATEASLLFINVQSEPAPTPSPTSEPLPPGRPLQILEGSCDPNALGEIVVELEDLRSPTDNQVTGQDGAIVAETSVTTVPLSLDELFADDHAIVAFTKDDNGLDVTSVACTEVGGTINVAGELVIGLREQDESGFTGIAYLAASENDAAETDISVFLAEGLAEDETQATSEP
jgi:hypothetical protein